MALATILVREQDAPSRELCVPLIQRHQLRAVRRGIVDDVDAKLTSVLLAYQGVEAGLKARWILVVGGDDDVDGRREGDTRSAALAP